MDGAFQRRVATCVFNVQPEKSRHPLNSKLQFSLAKALIRWHCCALAASSVSATSPGWDFISAAHMLIFSHGGKTLKLA